MNLLIMPGGGNPDASELYAKVFSLIIKGAIARGFEHVVKGLRWPGQTTEAEYDSAEGLSFTTSVVAARLQFETMPEGPFVVLARSYGCYVAAKLAAGPQMPTRRPERIVLWGPPPTWILWEMFARDIEKMKGRARQKGLKVDERFYASLQPIESLITQCEIPTVVAHGSLDDYCPKAFVEYLAKLTSRNPRVTYAEEVFGAPHEVTEDCGPDVTSAYLEAIFGRGGVV